MKILALDLSTKSSGYAIGENGILESYGTLSASSKDVKERIVNIRNQISKLIKENNINKIVLEQVRPEYNSHTGKVLMWLQSVIIIAAYEINPNIECQFFAASEWRSKLKIIQGRGIKRQILKKEDIQYVEKHHNIKVKNDDEADAICIFDAYFITLNREINWE